MGYGASDSSESCRLAFEAIPAHRQSPCLSDGGGFSAEGSSSCPRQSGRIKRTSGSKPPNRQVCSAPATYARFCHAAEAVACLWGIYILLMPFTPRVERREPRALTHRGLSRRALPAGPSSMAGRRCEPSPSALSFHAFSCRRRNHSLVVVAMGWCTFSLNMSSHANLWLDATPASTERVAAARCDPLTSPSVPWS